MKPTNSNNPCPVLTWNFNRRNFLRSLAFAGIGVSTLGLSGLHAAPANSKLRVLSIGVIGTIGGADRKAVASHPMAEIVGLCDVDSISLAKAAQDHPKAFTCKDYREAFEKHADKFDAVIVAVPDHSHAAIMLTAMAHDKHVYGQKPLVHQLAEIVMMEQAVAAKPQLVTQLGNQPLFSRSPNRSFALLGGRSLSEAPLMRTNREKQFPSNMKKLQSVLDEHKAAPWAGDARPGKRAGGESNKKTNP